MPFRQPRTRLLGSLRGSGTLKIGGHALPTDYALDRYADGAGQRADGSLSGDLSALGEELEDAPGVLVLENGAEIAVLVSNPSDEGADVSAQCAILSE